MGRPAADGLEVPLGHRVPVHLVEADPRAGRIEEIGRKERTLRMLRVVNGCEQVRLYRQRVVIRLGGEILRVEGKLTDCLCQSIAECDRGRLVFRLEDPVVGVPCRVVEGGPEIALEEEPFKGFADGWFIRRGVETVEQLERSLVGFLDEEVRAAAIEQRVGCVHDAPAGRQRTDEERLMKPIPGMFWIAGIGREAGVDHPRRRRGGRLTGRWPATERKGGEDNRHSGE